VVGPVDPARVPPERILDLQARDNLVELHHEPCRRHWSSVCDSWCSNTGVTAAPIGTAPEGGATRLPIRRTSSASGSSTSTTTYGTASTRTGSTGCQIRSHEKSVPRYAPSAPFGTSAHSGSKVPHS